MFKVGLSSLVPIKMSLMAGPAYKHIYLLELNTSKTVIWRYSLDGTIVCFWVASAITFFVLLSNVEWWRSLNKIYIIIIIIIWLLNYRPIGNWAGGLIIILDCLNIDFFQYTTWYYRSHSINEFINLSCSLSADCPTNCRFVPLLTSCFADKFLRILNQSSLPTGCPAATSTSSYNSAPQTSQIIPNLRSAYLDDLAFQRAQNKQNPKSGTSDFHPIFGKFLETAGILLEHEFASKSSTSDPYFGSVPTLEAIMREMFEPLTNQMTDIRRRLAGARSSAGSAGMKGKYGRSRPVNPFDVEFDAAELQRIATCLNGYSEAEFEDGVGWLKCLFICR